MEPRTPVYVVCSARPRLGKTLVARLLTEFLLADERPVTAFDVNPDEFTFSEFLPGRAVVADLSDTRGQIALFDNLVVNDAVAKVIDLGTISFERFFKLMQDLAFGLEAKDRAIEPVILFLADPDRRSIQGYANLMARFPDMTMVPVLNEGIWRVQQGQISPGAFPPQRAGNVAVKIPQLPAFLRGVVDKPGFSFSAYLRRPAEAETHLHSWIKRVFLELRELELRLLLERLKSNLQFQA